MYVCISTKDQMTKYNHCPDTSPGHSAAVLDGPQRRFAGKCPGIAKGLPGWFKGASVEECRGSCNCIANYFGLQVSKLYGLLYLGGSFEYSKLKIMQRVQIHC